MNDRREQEILAAVVHGTLTFGHALGFLHGLFRKRYGWALFHATAALLDGYAVKVHVNDARKA